MTDKILSQIEKNTRSLPQKPIEVNYNTNFYRLPLEESIDLSDGNYVMGVTSFNTYNSIFNITNKNNKIVYGKPIESAITNTITGEKFALFEWHEVVFPIGAYEISQINDEIIRQLTIKLDLEDNSQSPIRLEANEATLHSIIYLSDGYQIDFTQPGTLRDLLGFDSVLLQNAYNYSKKKVNIIDIHRLHLCCNSIIGSLRNGRPSNIIFTLVLNEPPGAKIVREPNLVLYKHIDKQKLDYLEFWMEDDDGNRIDNHGEYVAFTLHIKKNS